MAPFVLDSRHGLRPALARVCAQHLQGFAPSTCMGLRLALAREGWDANHISNHDSWRHFETPSLNGVVVSCVVDWPSCVILPA